MAADPHLLVHLLLLARHVIKALLRVVNLRDDLLNVVIDANEVLASSTYRRQRPMALRILLGSLLIPRRRIHLVILLQRRLRLFDRISLLIAGRLIQAAHALILLIGSVVE